MAIECDNCQGTEFEVQDGATFCLTCGTESQEHGQETVVDEETLGAFGDHAGSLRSRSIGKSSKSKKSQRKQEKYRLSYTSLAIFTYTLNGWVQDAINELKVDPQLNEIVLALWAQYLSRIKMAFTKRPTLSVSPRFRDMQVRITNRKRLLSPFKISHFSKPKKSKSTQATLMTPTDLSEDTSESRRRRRKAKKRYLESVASSMTSHDETSTSYVSSGTSDFEDDEEDSASDVWAEDHPDVEAVHMRILSRCSRSTTRATEESPEVPKMKTLFAIFSLGVLFLDDNKLSLCDLIRFANTGVISFDTASQHVPPVMKIKENYDLLRHTGINSHLNPFDHLKQRRLMCRVGSLLSLKKVNFGCVTDVLNLYLKEFSLPKHLLKMIKRSLGNSTILDLNFKFETYKRLHYNREANATPLVSSDVRAVALILFALKYLYGLDDISEYHQRNPDTFEIIQWIKLSRQRAFLACKYSSHFHRNFKNLFPRVKMSPGTWYAYLQQYRLKLSEMRNVAPNKKRFYANEEEMAKKFAKKLNCKYFQNDFNTQAKLEKLDLRKSKMPLFEFTTHYLDKAGQDEEKFEHNFQSLLAMHHSKIELKYVKEDLLEKDLSPPFVMSKFSINQKKSEQMVFFNNSKPTQSSECNFSPTYWIASLTPKLPALDSVENHSKEANNHLLSLLPENFAWILQYFAAVMDLKPSELYSELLQLECFLLETDSQYFGKKIHCVDIGNTHASVELKNRLSMSC